MRFFSLMAIVIAMSSSALAERYIVMMKDEAAVFAAHPSFENEIDGQITDRLHQLGTYIVDTDSAADVERLQQNSDVIYVEADRVLPWDLQIPFYLDKTEFTSAPTPTENPVAGATWGINAIKAPVIWPLSQQGLGARVLLIDSGLDKNHPYLKDNFEKGRDFTGESDGSDITDIRGHGTHVAGIIAAKLDAAGFSGVAPKAKLLMARACFEKGCSTAAMIAAINWGISQKVDVMNISISGISNTPAQAEAVKRADKAGISIVASSGNWGSNRVFYPAALPTVIAVGAVDPSLQRTTFSQYGPELSIVAPGLDVYSTYPNNRGKTHSVTFVSQDGKSIKVIASTFGGTREVRGGLQGELVDCGAGDPEDFKGKNVKGRFALIQRGGSKFNFKIDNAIKAGATAVIFINNRPGLEEGRLADPGVTLPMTVFMVESHQGAKVKQRLSKGEKVGATLQTFMASGFQVMSGTSMAAPHVTGVVALMKAANKKLSAAQVKKLLMQTASAPAGDNSQNQYGAGFLNAEAAVRASVK